MEIIGKDDICVDNVMEVKTGLLLSNVLEGVLRVVAESNNWEATE